MELISSGNAAARMAPGENTVNFSNSATAAAKLGRGMVRHRRRKEALRKPWSGRDRFSDWKRLQR
jgi:hypothetical protein